MKRSNVQSMPVDQNHENAAVANGEGDFSDSSSLTSMLNAAVKRNPVLAVAAMTTLGAFIALAVLPKRNGSQQPTQRLQRDLKKYAKNIQRTVRDELRDSGVSGRVENLGKMLGSSDVSRFFQPLIEQAAALAIQARDKVKSQLK